MIYAVDQILTFLPSQTRIGDGLSVAVTGARHNVLSSGHKVALDHKALDQRLQVLIVGTAVHDFMRDADLFNMLLVGPSEPHGPCHFRPY